MKLLKRVIAASSLFVLTLTPIQASANVLQKDTLNPPPTVIIENDIDVPEEIIEQLIMENPDVGSIHILDYGDMEQNLVQPQIVQPQISSSLLDPIGWTSRYENIKTTLTRHVADSLAKDEFKFSVARGETVTLSQTYEGSLTGSYTGSVVGDIGVSFSVKATYLKGTTYSGPAENSAYNSREFRMKFYQDIGTYNQTADLVTYHYLVKISSEPKSFTGTYYKPTKYLSYSLDKKL